MVALSNYFLQPVGLLALLGLLALAVFYLVKKKPDEEVMPSMAFFMERKEKGRLQHAFRHLLHNMMLLLQLLIVVGFAAALAHPFLNQPTTAEKAVIVLDNSASMSDNIEEAKSFARNNLGESNTLIVTNDDSRVVLQGAESPTVRSTIEDIETVDTSTDISSALRMAQNYEGKIVLASDLDDSYRNVDVEGRLIQDDREFETMETEAGNSWGVVDVEVTYENVSVDIKNFRRQEEEVSYSLNGEEKTVVVPSEAVETVKFEPETGRNTLKLEEDSLEADNTAYAYKPARENKKAVLISDNGNRYFEKALELIDFVDLEVVKPPVRGELDADVYILGSTDLVVSKTIRDVEEEVRAGDSLIIFGQQGMGNFGLESLPVTVQGGWNNSTVSINKPVKTSLRTSIIESEKVSGSSYSSPGEALVMSSEGRGDVFLYNIDDKDFRSNFLYPVFWKQVLEEMTERPRIGERNIETGVSINESRIVTPSGENAGFTTIEESGFYNTSSGVYAANLLSEDESSEESTAQESSTGKGQEKRDVQNLAVVLLLLLMLGEVAYLRYLGEM